MAFQSVPARVLAITLAAFAVPALAHAAAAAGDKVKGEALYKQRCMACHSVVEDTSPKPAPTFKGVVGRKAASVAAFKGYSAALKASGKTWTRPALDEFLSAPSKAVPGTYMAIAVPLPAERTDIIAYLATLK